VSLYRVFIIVIIQGGRFRRYIFEENLALQDLTVEDNVRKRP